MLDFRQLNDVGERSVESERNQIEIECPKGVVVGYRDGSEIRARCVWCEGLDLAATTAATEFLEELSTGGALAEEFPDIIGIRGNELRRGSSLLRGRTGFTKAGRWRALIVCGGKLVELILELGGWCRWSVRVRIAF